MATVKNGSDSLNLGEQVIEGKTKVVYKLPQMPGLVLIQSKDRITSGDGARANDLEGKAAISNVTNARVFNYLTAAGLKTHFVRQYGETAFVARHCSMIPIEWVTRRIATGSFLRRHPGVKEGYRFNPPKLETFYKDDANHDPQWSTEQLIAASLKAGNVTIGRDEVEYMSRFTVAIFELLEKAWATMNCALVDMKVEFGVCLESNEIILADVIDSDSWRLWPHGDKRLMKDKQVYRDLKEVTPEALMQVKSNFKWVADKVEGFIVKPYGRVAILMGSPSDMAHCEKIKQSCEEFGIPCDLRVTSAHKGTTETLRIVAEYEGMGVPVIFIAVAGRSNGLGPVLAGNTASPVINCPPLTADFNNDIWSSLRLPSGLGCGTVYSPEAAAQFAAHILGLNDHLIWAKLRVKQLSHWYKLNKADKEARQDE